MIATRFWILSSCLLFLLDCSEPKTSGNSTETENAIAFQIFNPNGSPAQGVAYAVRPLWYLSDTTLNGKLSPPLFEGTTNAKGWIHIQNQPYGSFLIQVIRDSLSSVFQYSHSESKPADDKQKLALQSYGAVKGKVNLPTNSLFAWIQIYGLESVTRTDSTGAFLLPSLPAGSLHLVAWTPSQASPLGQASFEILANDTLDLGLLPPPSITSEAIKTWKYERSLSPQTLISDWMRPISIPSVVTLRLDSLNFDFKQAQPDGRDFRIVKADGTYIPYDVVRWDTKALRAVLRIRIDSPSDTTETWLLKWGNNRALMPEAIQVWSGLSDSLALALNSVLVGDFENNSVQNSLPPPIASSSWYMGQSDSGVIRPATRDSFLIALQPADSGRSGTAAHFTYKAVAQEWVLLGTLLGPGPRSLATVDSFVFWHRGKGTFALSVEEANSEITHKALYKGTSTASWRRIRVRPSDFMKPDSIGGNYGWEFVKDRVISLAIFGDNGGEFWVDDIRIYGINRDDLR